MATSARQAGYGTSRRLNVSRVALTTAFTAVVFITLCWIGARIGIGPLTHMYVQLFSPAEISSALSLLIGLCWSLVGGLIGGGLFAWIYNLLAPLDAR